MFQDFVFPVKRCQCQTWVSPSRPCEARRGPAHSHLSGGSRVAPGWCLPSPSPVAHPPAEDGRGLRDGPRQHLAMAIITSVCQPRSPSPWETVHWPWAGSAGSGARGMASHLCQAERPQTGQGAVDGRRCLLQGCVSHVFSLFSCPCGCVWWVLCTAGPSPRLVLENREVGCELCGFWRRA